MFIEPHRRNVALGQVEIPELPAWYLAFRGILGVVGTALGAYHGYKRNDSVGWGIGWGLLGGAFPVIVIPLAFAQGFGRRKVKANGLSGHGRRRRRRRRRAA